MAEDPLEVAREQAEDPGLWFVPETITEDYLQRALRRLTVAVEGEEWRARAWGFFDSIGALEVEDG